MSLAMQERVGRRPSANNPRRPCAGLQGMKSVAHVLLVVTSLAMLHELVWAQSLSARPETQLPSLATAQAVPRGGAEVTLIPGGPLYQEANTPRSLAEPAKFSK